MRTSQAISAETELALHNLLKELWAQVPGINDEKLTIDVNFFAAGGDSLAATILLGKYNDRKATVKNLPDAGLGEFFQYPTIRRFVHEQLNKPANKAAKVRRKTSSSEPRIFLPAAQQASLFFLDTLHEDSSQYNCPYSICLHGDLCTDALQKALQTIIKRHEVLRSTFHLTKAQLECHINTEPAEALTIIDLSTTATDLKASTAKRLLDRDAQTPFKLSVDLMLRALLLKLDKRHYVLQLNVHHIAVDGMSCNILIQELNHIYSALVTGQSNDLAEPEFQYRDYCQQQQHWLKSSAFQQALTEYCAHLNRPSGFNNSAFPAIAKPEACLANTTGSLTMKIRAHSLRTIQCYCQQHQLTLFIYLQTLFCLALHQCFGMHSTTTGTPVSGRSHCWQQNMPGYFSSILLLAMNFSETRSIAELFKINKLNILRTLQWQNIPFSTIVSTLNPDRYANSNPLFQVCFSMNTFEQQQLKLPDIQVNSGDEHNKVLLFDLELKVQEHSGELEITCLFDRSKIDSTLCSEFCDNYLLLIKSVPAINANKTLSKMTS